jgi:hypothetical protein
MARGSTLFPTEMCELNSAAVSDRGSLALESPVVDLYCHPLVFMGGV